MTEITHKDVKVDDRDIVERFSETLKELVAITAICHAENEYAKKLKSAAGEKENEFLKLTATQTLCQLLSDVNTGCLPMEVLAPELKDELMGLRASIRILLMAHVAKLGPVAEKYGVKVICDIEDVVNEDEVMQ